uniref:Polyprotein n=1 Tax=Cajanus cajan TaxID=3821 RepID=A0A151R2H1_CAJCA|nr:polyprotein [Cajanus cajan]KYP36793.1 polyprotein [Cajanus cajan]
MATKTERGGLHSKEINTPAPTSSPLFSLDHIPPSQWRKKFLDFKAWLDAKMVHPGADQYKVIEEFCANMTGTLKEWYMSLGQVNQDNFHRTSIDEFLGGLQYHFLGESTLLDQIAQREYFEIRCCSLEKEDLDRHYQRMSHRFYQLNGMNDASLKNTYVSSFPEELQEEMWRILQQSNKDVLQMTMGEIY